MKRFAPLFAALLLVFALVFVKHNLDKAAPGEHEDEQASTSQSTPAKAPIPAREETEFLPEEMIGSGGAKYKITVGWVYNETNQPDPTALQDALGTVRQLAQRSDGAISAQIVNVDVPPEDRSPGAQAVTRVGVSVNGLSSPALSGNPGEGDLTAEKIMPLVSALMQGK